MEEAGMDGSLKHFAFKSISVLFLAAVVVAGADTRLPTIDLADLESGNDGAEFSRLRDSGGKFGAFAVRNIRVAGYPDAVADLVAEAPACVGGDFRHPQVTLGDGSTRRTVATSEGEYPDCLAGSAQTVASGFDAVGKAVAKMISVIAGKPMTFRHGEHGMSLNDAPHKDHIHVYEKRKSVLHHHHDHSSGGEYLVPYHVDNGIFLIITPFPNHGMRLQTSDGAEVDTDSVAQDSVLVLFGLGLTEWLLQRDDDAAAKFHPVPHSVPALKTIKHRSVFARMIVAPASAVPGVKGNDLLTFDQVFMQRKLNATNYDSQVCSIDLMSDRKGGGAHGGKDSWRDAMDVMCSEGEAYCWMGCYPLPHSCPTPNEARCFSKKTNVTCSTEPGGKPMDPTCKWECRPEVDGVYRTSSYCNGKMDMLMTGFDVSGKKENPCIVLFIESWTLDTPAKFWLGCFGVAALGFSIEALIALRRAITRRRNPKLISFRGLGVGAIAGGPGSRHCLIIACFALNLVLGYLAMLVVMSYSLELFTFVVLGLVAGHAFFNWNTAVGESVDPCCATSQNDVCLSKRGCDDACVNLRLARRDGGGDVAANDEEDDGGGTTALTVKNGVSASATKSPSHASNDDTSVAITTCCNGSPVSSAAIHESRTEDSFLQIAT